MHIEINWGITIGWYPGPVECRMQDIIIVPLCTIVVFILSPISYCMWCVCVFSFDCMYKRTQYQLDLLSKLLWRLSHAVWTDSVMVCLLPLYQQILSHQWNWVRLGTTLVWCPVCYRTKQPFVSVSTIVSTTCRRWRSISKKSGLAGESYWMVVNAGWENEKNYSTLRLCLCINN